jgi:hypothetical protein
MKRITLGFDRLTISPSRNARAVRAGGASDTTSGVRNVRQASQAR